MRAIAVFRLVPTINLFSELWRAFIRTVGEMWHEKVAAEYLDSLVFVVPASSLPGPLRRHARPPQNEPLCVANWWIGIYGIVPGQEAGRSRWKLSIRPGKDVRQRWSASIRRMMVLASCNLFTQKAWLTRYLTEQQYR